MGDGRVPTDMPTEWADGASRHKVRDDRPAKRFAMCPPTYFDVTYSINPWMDPDTPTDRDLAGAQWQALYSRLVSAGHRVDLVDPLPGQPDMVFIANAAVVLGGRGVSARFQHPHRRAEENAYHEWLESIGLAMKRPEFVNEGAGDFVTLAGNGTPSPVVFAGYGMRTELAAHREVAEYLDVEVVSLELVDERFYHLDTALSIIDAGTAIYYPGAFSESSRLLIAKYVDRPVPITDQEAAMLAANAVSDGRNVFLDVGAQSLADEVARLGFEPVPLDMSELRKSGGGLHCCVLELG